MFQRIAKFIMTDFCEMNFMKSIAILLKVDEMYTILKSASHCLLVERLQVELDDQSFCWSLSLNVHTFTTSLL